NTHTHTVTGNTGAAVGTSYAVRGGGTQVAGANVNHTHSVATTTFSSANEPPYIQVILGSIDATSSPVNDIIAMWSGDAPTLGWVDESGSGKPLENRYLKPSSTYGSTGGFSTSTHADQLSATTSVPSATSNGRQQLVTPASAGGSHTHLVDIT